MSAANSTTVVGYCRRSKESGARTIGLEEQAAQIQRYVAEHGWALAVLVTNDRVSGGKRARLARIETVVRAHRRASSSWLARR